MGVVRDGNLLEMERALNITLTAIAPIKHPSIFLHNHAQYIRTVRLAVHVSCKHGGLYE